MNWIASALTTMLSFSFFFLSYFAFVAELVGKTIIISS